MLISGDRVFQGRGKNQSKGPGAGDCQVRGGGREAKEVTEVSQSPCLGLEPLFWVEEKPSGVVRSDLSFQRIPQAVVLW